MISLEKSKKHSRLNKFSYIYIEKEALLYPLTAEILTRFPKSKIIEIDRYQEIFNRSKQNWRESKEVQKLILAVKKDKFLHTKSDVIQGGANDRFFYTTPILNCTFDCDYCFLQGMYNSPHAVIFVNVEDFFLAATAELKNGPMILSPSYETDLLGFEGIAPITREWLGFAKEHPNLSLEIRTKSSAYRSIDDIKPIPNVILAWTISPDDIAKKYEKGTSSTKARIEALNAALHDGWQVRLCIDPILAVHNWEEVYAEFFKELSSQIPLTKLYDIWVGTFRMNESFLKKIQNSRSDSDILHYPFTKDKREPNVAMYPHEVRSKAIKLAHDIFLDSGVLKDKIVGWE